MRPVRIALTVPWRNERTAAITWFSGILVYVIIWWVVFFAVLPWGVRVPETHEPGHATSAPERPMLWRKVAITSLIAAVLWVVAYLLIESDLLPVRVATG
ncbi:MAG TPA: DUF1467 family protein [Kiloniellales bacterium]